MIGLIFLNIIAGLIVLNLYNRRRTIISVDKALKKIKWKHLSKEQYLKKSHAFIAERFAKVNKCWLKYPWRNMFFANHWKMKGKGLSCHMMNTIFQRFLLKRFKRREMRTITTKSFQKGMMIHFYSKVKLNGKWIDADVWGKKWGIPLGKNIHNSEVI